MEADIARGAYIDPVRARITVGEWCETWIDGYGANQESTVRQARVHINRIVQEFGEYPIGSLRPSQVKSWVTRLQSEELKTSARSSASAWPRHATFASRTLTSSGRSFTREFSTRQSR